ncbi:MAG: inorganic diphosphatase [Roseiflexus sp.]|jgi:Inorganic pyrophosphatase|nr:inorganic diphosphatase [Roseiflexus sp.]MBO9334539.1 inorganic diphosphatase [Roseiflexus sp.]MBO9366741.1 inorganic diphosphatase [Roseiflexus sp.]MBO9384796.1 inorganic diphosphatase [Roseiflexus sp.]MBO9389958.1 inorganic diphosphatase [Roseiflexus sp.]
MTMNLWHELESGPNTPEVVHVVVEIPKGSRNKYEYHKQTGAFKLDRVLYSAVHYPGDYGFIPQTYYDDGDPLDVLVMTNLPTFTGCIVEARPIGLFRMTDRGEPDDKILAVLHYDPFFADFNDYTQLPAHYLKEVEHFFTVYKDLEGARVEPIGWENAVIAKERVCYAVNLYWDMRAGRLPKRV